MTATKSLQGVVLYDAAGVEMYVEDGVAIPADTKAVLIAGKEGSNARLLRTAADGTVRIDPSGTTTQPISASALPLPSGAATAANQVTAQASLTSIDGKDFATQTTLATLATETKLEAVRVLLNSIDGKDFATQTTLATLATETKLEAVRVLLSSIDGKDFATQTTLASVLSQLDVALSTRATEATLSTADGRLATIDAVLDSIKDTDGVKKITDALPVGDNVIGRAKLTDGTLVATLTADAGVNRQEISGKVTVVGASPPPATTAATINADTPLTVGSHDTSFVIPNGETFYLQNVTAGNEDPTKGASIEVIYDNGAEHTIARVYIAGFTTSIGFNDLSEARDGTALVGNGAHEVIVRRAKFSGTNIAIDAVVSGYTV